MNQDKAGIQPCVSINKKDDDRRESLRKAQKTTGNVVRVKEQSKEGKKRRQQVMDTLLTPPTKKSVEGSFMGSQKSGSKEVDAVIASFFYENGISFNVANSSSFGRMIDESMKFAKQNPLQSLKLFLRPLVSRIGLLTGTSTRRSETGLSLQPLKSLFMFTPTAKWSQRLAMLTNSRCLLGILKMLEPERYGARVRPESPSRRVAESLILAESPSRESRLRDSARLGQPCSSGRPMTQPWAK